MKNKLYKWEIERLAEIVQDLGQIQPNDNEGRWASRMMEAINMFKSGRGIVTLPDNTVVVLNSTEEDGIHTFCFHVTGPDGGDRRNFSIKIQKED